MAEAVVDVLEVVHVDHGEREPALQILEPLVVIAAVVDLGDRVHIHLPVAHEQLVEHISRSNMSSLLMRLTSSSEYGLPSTSMNDAST